MKMKNPYIVEVYYKFVRNGNGGFLEFVRIRFFNNKASVGVS